MKGYQPLPTKVELTDAESKFMTEARVAFMRACPFFGYYYWEQMVEWPTYDIETAATDGRHIMYNPKYLAPLKVHERVFVLAHEVYHTILRHPTRMQQYRSTGKLRGLPYDPELYNIAADFVINYMLVKNDIGQCNPNWLYDPAITDAESVEEVYVKLYKKPPPPPPGGGGATGGSAGAERGDKPGSARAERGYNPPQGPLRSQSRKGGTPDPRAKGGRFDTVLEPYQDPATGRQDIPGDSEFREAIAKAAAAAKAIGKLPGDLQRTVDEIMEPQVDWKEQIRMLVTGKVGHRRETWDRPNRRRLVLNPIIYLPGKKGHGCELVTCVVDNSGSISDDEMAAFFAEMGAILNDCRPKEVMVIWCDAAVRRVECARTLDELAHIRVQGSKGGGGTNFNPPFAYLTRERVKPDTLVYLTDMMGPFPNTAPSYPVIWCKTTDGKAPFGEEVRIKI